MDKRLYKSSANKMICGVCGGLSEYFNIDVSIIRILFAIFGLFAFTGVIIYFIMALILPEV